MCVRMCECLDLVFDNMHILLTACMSLHMAVNAHVYMGVRASWVYKCMQVIDQA